MSLTGQEKVALLLASLPPEVREQVLRRLGEIGEELRQHLQNVDRMLMRPDLVRQLAAELERALTATEIGPRFVRPAALSRARQAYRGETGMASSTSNENESPAYSADSVDALVDRIRAVPAAELAEILSDEPPAVVATLLQALGPSEAAPVLPYFPSERAALVSARLIAAAPPNPRVVLHVLKGVLRKLEGRKKDIATPSNQRLRWLADTIRRLPSSERVALLERLAESDPENVARLRRLVYQVDDLLNLPDDIARRIINKLDARLLAAATAQAGLPVRNKVLRLVPARVAEVLRDLWASGDLTQEEQQRGIDALVNRLEELEHQGEQIPLGVAA